MDRLTSIVVGIDFTPNSAAALSQALRIAQWHRAALRVVHVIETLVASEIREAVGEFQRRIEASLLEDARAAWRAFAAGVPGAAELPLDVGIGQPLERIVEAVREARADLLVLGVRGSSAESGAGGLATSCVRYAPTRVLLVREDQPGPFRSVAVGVDFSPTSREAVDQALRVAARDGAAVHVVHVFNPPWGRLHYKSPTPQAEPDFKNEYRTLLLEHLRRFCGCERPEAAWAKPRYHLVESGGHGAGLSAFVAEQKADLLVLGTRGRTNLRDLIMGSTAERVVRDAPCSILAIKPA